jgi:YfiH family protein
VIYNFNLEFKSGSRGMPYFAVFPFIMDGIPCEGISCGISSRYAGDMKFGAQNPNRLNLFRELGLNPANVYGLNQIHSQSVLAVGNDTPVLAGADGMVTRDDDITLSVTVADCLPVYLFDTKSGAFGIVHSGWKGTGIVLAALNLMKEKWGTNPREAAAVLGPCIDNCCYKVDAQRAGEFEKNFGAGSVRNLTGGYFLNLKAANIKLLSDAGVENIAVCAECTFTDNRLGSFRREGETYTRMAALVFRKA